MENQKIRIAREKCIECGMCAKECVSAVIGIREGKPYVIEPDWCNLCSHCQAICPSGAVINELLSGTDKEPIKVKELNPEAYRDIVRTRRSVRWFKDEPVDRSEIEEILDLVRFSPTASNTMDVGYTIITDKKKVAKIGDKVFALAEKMKTYIDSPVGKAVRGAVEFLSGGKNIGNYLDRFYIYREWVAGGRNLITYNAPCLVVIHGPKKGKFTMANSMIAATNFTNYAHARGLGACYIGFLTVAMDVSKSLSRMMGVPPDRKGYIALTLGKPQHKFRNIPIRPEADVTWIE